MIGMNSERGTKKKKPGSRDICAEWGYDIFYLYILLLYFFSFFFFYNLCFAFGSDMTVYNHKPLLLTCKSSYYSWLTEQ
jgi:hypothetical protein